jgi:hypothetical protein
MGIDLDPSGLFFFQERRHYMIFHLKESDHFLCDKHRAGVDAKDKMAFINRLVTETINNQLFKEFCGYSDENKTPALSSKIPEVLPSVLPLCCFLRDSAVNRIKSEIAAMKSAPQSSGRALHYHTVPSNQQAKEYMEQIGWRFLVGFENLPAAEHFVMGYRMGRSDHETSIAVMLHDDPDKTRYEIWIWPKQ